MPKSQSELAGIEAPSHPHIDEACDNYIHLKLKRKDLNEKLKEAEAELVAAMQAKDLLVYRYENTLITIDPVQKVKVKDVAGDEDDED